MRSGALHYAYIHTCNTTCTHTHTHTVCERDAMDVALCLCCIFGLGPPAVFLIEHGARVDHPLTGSNPTFVCNVS